MGQRQRLWGVYINGELQYPAFRDMGQGDVVAIYRRYADACKRRREMAEANPTEKVTVRRVVVLRRYRPAPR